MIKTITKEVTKEIKICDACKIELTDTSNLQTEIRGHWHNPEWLSIRDKDLCPRCRYILEFRAVHNLEPKDLDNLISSIQDEITIAEGRVFTRQGTWKYE